MSEKGPRRRVVVTGVGTINPLGNDVATTWDAMCTGTSGIAPVTLFDATGFPARIAGEVKGFDPQAIFGRRRARHLDRFAQFAIVATSEAMDMANLDVAADPWRVGVAYGTALGGLGTLEENVRTLSARGPSRVSPYMSAMILPNIAAGEIAMTWGVKGPNTCTVTACAASAHALGSGYDMIRLGRVDAMICGGAEAAITPIGLAGFAATAALSTRNDEPERASRPFDAERDGFVTGEGAATVVLEERESALRRGATVLAELVGYGATSDAHHITAPHPSGDGAVHSMRMALDDAGLLPADVSYVNAHGTSTVLNDRIETLAVRTVLGTGVPLSSTKSMTGHLLGAAGALEAVVCVQALQNALVPPTINLQVPDPECDLDYVPNHARPIPVDVAMSNSFGFGGHNATLVLRSAG
ncbi:MAG: beta-ketoacyl-ACP synthase II [Acidimicrobiales bacterium]